MLSTVEQAWARFRSEPLVALTFLVLGAAGGFLANRAIHDGIVASLEAKVAASQKVVDAANQEVKTATTQVQSFREDLNRCAASASMAASSVAKTTAEALQSCQSQLSQKAATAEKASFDLAACTSQKSKPLLCPPDTRKDPQAQERAAHAEQRILALQSEVDASRQEVLLLRQLSRPNWGWSTLFSEKLQSMGLIECKRLALEVLKELRASEINTTLSESVAGKRDSFQLAIGCPATGNTAVFFALGPGQAQTSEWREVMRRAFALRISSAQ